MLRKLADKTSFALLRSHLVKKGLRYLSYQRKRQLRREVEARLRASGKYGDEVLQGPFAGLRYPDPEHWASCRFEKVIGCYEHELNGSIAQLVEASGDKYTDVIVVGAAEGYYAAGFGKVLPQAKLYAFEPLEQRVEVMRNLAETNGLGERLTIGGLCDPDTLNGVPAGEFPLVVCDVDGYEETIMDPEAIPMLKRSDIILELHDFIVPNISETIEKRFASSHDIEVLKVSSVPYERFPVLEELTMPEIQAMTDSDRPRIHNWYVMRAKR